MRYINRRFTSLLTYLLTYIDCRVSVCTADADVAATSAGNRKPDQVMRGPVAQTAADQ